MSRALDRNVKEALKCSENEPIFQEISQALDQRHETLLELEILGRSHVANNDVVVLQDDHAIAVPKLRLVQAFIVAYKLFHEHMKSAGRLHMETIRCITSVMLLMDPEHITAANARKKFIRSTAGEATDYSKLLLDEKYILDSILTSHLHRHTKSPNLWNHRRWLMQCLSEAGIAVDVGDDMLRVIFVSAERHPRNYYAWCHARDLIDAGFADAQSVQAMVEDTKKWCFSHHDDVSGWTFLAFLLRRSPDRVATVFEETLQLTETLRWRNESVWYFLCVLISDDRLRVSRRETLQTVLRGWQLETDGDGSDKWLLDRASGWLKSIESCYV
jgi:protein prenyltransferase alpha subunit repeat containing protein 1